MRASLEAHVVQLDEAPIEKPDAIGAVERYHAPLRLAYERIKAESDNSTTDQECLDLDLFSINYTVGLEGLCP